MSVKYILLLVLFLLSGLFSCRNNSERSVPVNKPGQDQMADLNRYFIQKDKERIQNYIVRKKLKMKESPTGLWYQVINEGSGENFSDNDKLSFDYDCSLLDGTKCYSSKELGPKEVVLGRSNLEQGLYEGIRMLKPGAEAIFIIPPYLGYGLLGDRKNIPPRAVIVYNVYNLCAK
jgi:FKBP-type peptidyl-prolyl cis-trans isomerase